ncbi:MAG: NAD-dependent epimerase/dehydratase family protein [Deltaproteobacteria bacterium]|nr:NAD-dependent epimerase/dehydratase family protein [Deltaproteobacteria bacterium]
MSRQGFKRALVTGGAGFIGSHIAEKLLSIGMETVVIDDLSMGKAEYVPEGAGFYRGSILDGDVLKEALRGADVVFHNAARVSIRDSFEGVCQDAETNVMGTVRLLHACARAGVKKVVYASSMAVYGNDGNGVLKENGSPLAPLSPYGIGKLAGEQYGMQISEYYGFDFATLRYFNTFGTRQTFTPYVGVITIFITALLQGRRPVIFGSGAQTRDFIHVEDVAEANVRMMSSPVKRAVINVGAGQGTKVVDIARLLIERINKGIAPAYAEAPMGEPEDSVADVTAMREVLGFTPKTTLVDRVDSLIEWNRARLAENA